MRKVNLNDIRIDGGTQGRVVIDQQHVYHMVEMMKEGYEFDPIDTNFDGATYWLVDGFHRYHAYKLMGIKEVTVKYVPGTMEEAVIRSYGVNARHGLPRSYEDKKKVVLDALANPLLKDKSNYEIAKICVVSQPFVAGIKDPEKKQKQKEAKEKNIKKKAEELNTETPADTNLISNQKVPEVQHVGGEAPDEDELKANELAMQADLEMLNKLLESDDALATAHEEIKRLNYLNAQLEVRMHGLMNEKNEAIKLCKKLQKENDKLKGKK